MKYASIKHYALSIALPGDDAYRLPQEDIRYEVVYDGVILSAADIAGLVQAITEYRRGGKVVPVVAVFVPEEGTGP